MSDCYSRDEETFYPDLSDVLDMLDGDGELVPGTVIYEGDTVQRKASHYARGCVDTLVERMGESATEECGEFAPEDWPGVETKKWDELEKLIDNWLDANVKVNFWTVANIKKRVLTEADIAEYRGTDETPTERQPDGIDLREHAEAQAHALGVEQPDDSSTVQQINAPDAGPMPTICDGMSKAEIWAYAHLCGYRAASIAGVPQRVAGAQEGGNGHA